MSIHRLANVIGERSVAVVIPSYNEGLTIASVVLGFQKALPGADITVFDGDSDDNTAHMARGGRCTRRTGFREKQKHPGQSNVFRH